MSSALEIELIGGMPDGFDGLELTPLEKVVAAVSVRREALALPAGTINVSFVDDETIQAYNRDYSGNDYATDVLSFSYIEDGEPIEGVIGEMVISLETARRQAEAGGITLADETAILCLHGILHIGGYDHQGDAERGRMQELQRDIATEVGVTYRDFQWLD